MNRRDLLLSGTSLVTASALAAPSLATAAQAQQQPAGRRPNIVFMLTDNLGYGELGVYGGGILRGAPTPRIERRGLRRFTIGVSEDDLRVTAEHGYEGAASTEHDQRAQAVSLFITDMLAASIGQGPRAI
jgi:hypothetical protein